MDMHSNYTECLTGWLFVVERDAFDLKYFTENPLTYFLPVRTTAQLCLKDQWAEYVENEES